LTHRADLQWRGHDNSRLYVAQTGSDARPPQDFRFNLHGWRGDETYVATVPAIYNIWQDPQERYDLFMNSYTEKTWTLPIFNKATQELMKTYVEYPPRPLQSEVFTGPMEIQHFRTLERARQLLKEKGIVLPELEGKQ
jgi:arylsulfatase